MAVFVLDVLSLSKGIRVQTLATSQRCLLIYFLKTTFKSAHTHSQITQIRDILQSAYLNVAEFIVTRVEL